jgi:succinate dehydrogenase/fumarate reductase cytochrome b subunit
MSHLPVLARLGCMRQRSSWRRWSAWPKVRQVHRTSAWILAIFGVLHLLNQTLAVAGPEAHQAGLELWRWAYRGPLTQPLLLMTAAFHAVTGLRLWWLARHTPALRWQRLTGLYLTLFLVAHPAAALYQRTVVGLDSNFYWAAAVLRWPFVLWFAPYYTLGVVSFVVHIALATKVARPLPALLFALALAGLILSGLSGALGDARIPPAYL